MSILHTAPHIHLSKFKFDLKRARKELFLLISEVEFSSHKIGNRTYPHWTGVFLKNYVPDETALVSRQSREDSARLFPDLQKKAAEVLLANQIPCEEDMIGYETSLSKKFPYLLDLCNKLAPNHTRSGVSCLKSNGVIDWHSHEYMNPKNRGNGSVFIHLPLETNKKASMLVKKEDLPTEQVHYGLGEAWIFNQNYLHRAENLHETKDRYHLGVMAPITLALTEHLLRLI